jgi:hypothetical protein
MCRISTPVSSQRRAQRPSADRTERPGPPRRRRRQSRKQEAHQGKAGDRPRSETAPVLTGLEPSAPSPAPNRPADRPPWRPPQGADAGTRSSRCQVELQSSSAPGERSGTTFSAPDLDAIADRPAPRRCRRSGGRRAGQAQDAHKGWWRTAASPHKRLRHQCLSAKFAGGTLSPGPDAS